MPGKRHSEEHILYTLRQIEAGKKVSEVRREMKKSGLLMEGLCKAL